MKNFFKPKKILTFCLFILILLSLGFFLKNSLKSIFFLKYFDDKNYVLMDYQEQFNYEKLFTSQKFKYFMYGFKGSVFVIKNPGNQIVVSKNYDGFDSAVLTLKFFPKNGYKFSANVALAALKINDVKLLKYDIKSRLKLLLAPYFCIDGMNEKGLFVGIVEFSPNIKKTNLTNHVFSTMVVKKILTECSSVDLAVELLKNADLKLDKNTKISYFITDFSGKSVIVSCINKKIEVKEAKFFSYMTADKLNRNLVINNKLVARENVLTENDCKTLLSDTKSLIPPYLITQWSSVYNLNAITLKNYLKSDFNNYELVILQ